MAFEGHRTRVCDVVNYQSSPSNASDKNVRYVGMRTGTCVTQTDPTDIKFPSDEYEGRLCAICPHDVK